MSLVIQSDSDDVAALRSSPIHNLRPVQEAPVEIDIESIEIDPTNPGSLTDSLRNQRRNPAIRDSWDIIGRIVYPIVVCEQPDAEQPYMHVDGLGRLSQAKSRGQTRIRAIVYPPMSLEQRICLRETLNAAQEPFDAASIVRDLQELANARKLDLRDEDQIRTLVRDLPEKVRKHEAVLVALARWDPEAAGRIGESYRGGDGTIGLDKVKSLTNVIDVINKRHPQVAASLGGDVEISKKLAKMYVDGRFRKGRSQQALREVVKALKEMPENDNQVREFFRKEQDWQVLLPNALRADGPVDLVNACAVLTKALISVDTNALSPAEKKALSRTRAVLNEVLAS